MVDFKRLLAEQAARRTPEQQARYEQREAREKAADETAISLPARFTSLNDALPAKPVARCALTAGRRAVPSRSASPNVLTKPVTLRILTVDDSSEECREVVEFSGTPTGAVRYTLDSRFCGDIAKAVAQDEETTFTLCFGRKNQYDQCDVDLSSVADYLREHRPQLFDTATPALRLPQP